MANNLQVEKIFDSAVQPVKDDRGNSSSLSLSKDAVGIGTVAPVSKLHILSAAGDHPPRLQSAPKGTGFAAGWDFYSEGVGKGYIGVPDASAAFGAGELLLYGGPGTTTSLWAGSNRSVTLDPKGNVDVAGELQLQSNSNPVHFTSVWRGWPSVAVNHAEISNDTDLYKTLMIVGNYSAGLGRRVSVWDRLEVNGALAVTGDVEVAGDIRLTNADCAEDFDIGTAVLAEPGSVMVLGAGAKLFPCEQAYDKRAAGVVSGAGDYKPGIVLDKQSGSAHRQPIALIGKVYCKVDARFGAVGVGDLLTTSETPGHAMKAGDPARAPGAVIGKALGSLAEGQALVPILIALQ